MSSVTTNDLESLVDLIVHAVTIRKEEKLDLLQRLQLEGFSTDVLHDIDTLVTYEQAAADDNLALNQSLRDMLSGALPIANDEALPELQHCGEEFARTCAECAHEAKQDAKQTEADCDGIVSESQATADASEADAIREQLKKKN